MSQPERLFTLSKGEAGPEFEASFSLDDGMDAQEAVGIAASTIGTMHVWQGEDSSVTGSTMRTPRLALVIGSMMALVTLQGCDNTAEEACRNANCPVGTTISLSAQSRNICSGSAASSEDASSADGQCYIEGYCTYACRPLVLCCGEQTFEIDSYSCSMPCLDSEGRPIPTPPERQGIGGVSILTSIAGDWEGRGQTMGLPLESQDRVTARFAGSGVPGDVVAEMVTDTPCMDHLVMKSEAAGVILADQQLDAENSDADCIGGGTYQVRYDEDSDRVSVIWSRDRVSFTWVAELSRR